MKVLQINSICGYGSTGRIVADLHDYLNQNGHDCKIAYGLGIGKGIKQEDLFYFGNKLDYYTHNFLSRLTDRAGFYSRRQTFKLVSFINKYKPDIIHLHNIHGFYINIDVLFSELKKLDIPIIWTLHDCWPYTGHCAHYSDNRCYKWKSICDNCTAKDRYPRSYFISQAKRNYIDKRRIFTGVNNLHITTPSDWLNNQVKDSFLGVYPVTTINNGIDTDVFKPMDGTFKEKYGIADKVMILGVSSAWIPQKGFNDFVKLAGMLDDTYRIVIVGMGEIPVGIPNNIIVLPAISNQNDLVDIYSSADIYVSFSVEETFGLPTVEAMACGTPVLTYDETALPEPVTSETGVIVKSHDVEAAFKAITNYPSYKKDSIIKHAALYKKENKYEEFLKLYLHYYEMRSMNAF